MGEFLVAGSKPTECDVVCFWQFQRYLGKEKLGGYLLLRENRIWF